MIRIGGIAYRIGHRIGVVSGVFRAVGFWTSVGQ